MEIQNIYSNNDILNLFYIHGECSKVVDRTVRTFNERFPHLPPMNKTKFKRIQSNFLRFGKVTCSRRKSKPVTGKEENQEMVLAYFHANPESSIPAASQDIGLPYTPIQRILAQHKMHPFSFISLQGLQEGDDRKRIEFCEFILTKTQENNDFLSQIIWTDEAKFSRDGLFNRRNKHFWAQENPHVIRESRHQKKFSFNVFCLISNGEVRFEIYNQNLNSEKYLQILRGLVAAFLEEVPEEIRREYWYQLDGAPGHSSRAVYNLLVEMFEDRWIGNGGPWRWPPRSPDLTPLDFYLWGHIKNQVYDTPVNNVEDLRIRVQTALEQLDREEVRRAATSEIEARVLRCLEQNGRHIEHL